MSGDNWTLKEPPSGWMTVVLPEISEILLGQSPESSTYNLKGIGLPFFQGKAEFGALYPDVLKYCSAPVRVAEPHSVLLSVRAPVGPTNLTARRCCIGRGLASIRPLGGISEKFILYWLRSIESRLSGLGTGSTFGAISKDILSNIRLNLPPLSGQSRIVAKIEDLFSELDKGVENLTTVRVQLRAYRQSLFKHAFGGTPTDSLGPGVSPARLVRLGDVIEYLTSGSRGWADYYSDVGEIFIRAQNLKHDRLELGDIAFVKLPQGLTEGIRTRVRRGDVLITITGANVTKTGLVDKDLGTAYVSQHVALCRPSASLRPEYLYWYLLAETGGRKQLTKAAYGAGKPGLNLDNIRNIVIPLPSIEQQTYVASWIAEGIDAERNISKTVAEELSRISALRSSILKKAFSGQLVPQDPNDEPASALLQRIRAGRGAGKPRNPANRSRGEAA